MFEAYRKVRGTTLTELDATIQSNRLREIVKEGLTAIFQPIYAVDEDLPVAIEGLIRGPVGEVLELPDRLFHAAQEANMTSALDEAAYLTVLMSFAALRWTGKLFLNIRPSTLLRSTSSAGELRRAVAAAGLHPSQIILELTEHEPIPNAEALLRALDPLFEEGMTLSLDDVGAGYASLRVLCELQPHFIKVDRFFIEGIAESLVKQSVVQNFVNLASDIGAKVVAEGVELRSDAQVVLQLGIGLMQGNFFARPTAKPCLVLPPDDAENTNLPTGRGAAQENIGMRAKCHASLMREQRGPT